jgi:Tfp pilus assembly pilus retraction ATPase PilT
MGMPLNEILKVAIKGGASDIHLKSGLPPMFRVDGALVPLKNGERLMPDEIQKIAMDIMNPVQKQRFEENREADLAYGIAGLGRFRVNVFQQRGTFGVVFRSHLSHHDDRGPDRIPDPRPALDREPARDRRRYPQLLERPAGCPAPGPGRDSGG